MRKWIIAGVILLAAGAVVTAALWNLNSLIDRNRDYLIGQAEEALGRKVSVGEAQVTLWGGIGLRLDDFALSDDASFNAGDFVRAGDLQVNVKFFPLLRKKLEIKRLILHDPVIAIIKNEEGAFNFSGIGKGKKEKREAEKGPVAEAPEPGDEREPPLLAIALVDISNGAVHYVDRKEKIDLRIQAIDFRVKELGFDKAFPVELAAALFTDKQNLKLQGTVGPLPSEGHAARTPFEGRVTIDPLDFGLLISAVPKLRAALPPDLELSGLLRIKDAELKGTAEGFGIKGVLEATEMAVALGDTFRKPAGIPFAFSTEAHYNGGAVSLHQARLRLHTLDLSGAGELRWGDVAGVNLTLDSSRSSLAGWETILPLLSGYGLSGDFEAHATLRGKMEKGISPEIEGSLVLAGAGAQPPQLPQAIRNLNGRVHFTGQSAEIKEATFSLGNSDIHLVGQIGRFSPLSLSYQASASELRPADFQPSIPEERASDVLKNLKSEGSLSAKNGNVAFQGRVASDQGTLYKIGYRDLAATLAWANQTANIRNLRVTALDGTLEAEGEYSTRSPSPRFSLASQLRGVDLAELYRALDPSGSRDIQGRLQADLNVSGSGREWTEIKSNLRGQGWAEVLDGALLDFNLAEGALSGITGIPGLTSLINPQVRQKYPETFEARDTVFKELSAVFELAEGRANIKNLRIAAADYSTQGSGWVDFDRRVDFRSSLLFSQPLSADLAHAAREVKYIFNEQDQLQIPFVLSGTLPNVRPKPDTRYLAQLFQRGLARRGAEELKRRFLDPRESSPSEQSPPSDSGSRERRSTEEMIRRGLEGLFGR